MTTEEEAWAAAEAAGRAVETRTLVAGEVRPFLRLHRLQLSVVLQHGRGLEGECLFRLLAQFEEAQLCMQGYRGV